MDSHPSIHRLNRRPSIPNEGTRVTLQWATGLNANYCRPDICVPYLYERRFAINGATPPNIQHTYLPLDLYKAAASTLGHHPSLGFVVAHVLTTLLPSPPILVGFNGWADGTLTTPGRVHPGPHNYAAEQAWLTTHTETHP